MLSVGIIHIIPSIFKYILLNFSLKTYEDSRKTLVWSASTHTGFESTLEQHYCSGQVAKLVGVSCQYTKVAGSIPSQDTYKKQPVNA